MIILGPEETLKLIDGSDKHTTVRALKGVSDRVSIAAPALAFAADAISGARDGERQRLENELQGLIDRGREEPRPGLFAGVPAVPILPFGRDEARAFPRIVAALKGGKHPMGTLLIQTITIAQLREASVLLERTEMSEDMGATLAAAGIHFSPYWA